MSYTFVISNNDRDKWVQIGVQQEGKLLRYRWIDGAVDIVLHPHYEIYPLQTHLEMVTIGPVQGPHGGSLLLDVSETNCCGERTR